ncbi:MAG: Hsp20/alpha crystallin family protein [Verrucomicrobia bacterium]|nr:Hsp20/alpha crystallin family protein [Verrucomicrobiota bacterium]
MNMTTNWNPKRDLELLQNRIHFLFGSPIGSFRPSTQPESTNEWTPLVDIAEDDKEFTIKADLPDVKKENVKVTLEDGSLCIAGERKQEKNGQQRFHRSERPYGSFERRFSLPEAALADKMKAEFENGMLRVHIPKAEKKRPETMSIEIH